MIHSVTDIDMRLVAGPFAMPPEMRARVAAHWAEVVAANPHVWDGRILMTSAPGTAGGVAVVDGVLRAEAREDAYSAFLAWRDWGFPEMGIRNLFGSALILSADNALIYGVMGSWTVNAGMVYPPGGSLEPRDVSADGRIDVLASIDTELFEETGLRASEAERGEILAVFNGAHISVGQVFRFAEPADALAARIRGNLDAQEHRELDDVVVLRSVADLVAAGRHPPYAAEVVAHLLG